MYAAHYLRILSRLEQWSTNELTAAWVSTTRNEEADHGSRDVHLDHQDNVVGKEILLRRLNEYGPGWKLVSWESLFRHYFLSDYGLRSLQLHYEEDDCEAARLASMRGKATGDRVLNLGDAGYVELCAGCGQMLAAAEARGLTPVAASDSDPTARYVLGCRFKGSRLRVLGAMEHERWERLPYHLREKVLAMAAGFPCVAFSRIGLQKGSHDSRAWIGYWAIKEVLPYFPNLLPL